MQKAHFCNGAGCGALADAARAQTELTAPVIACSGRQDAHAGTQGGADSPAQDDQEAGMLIAHGCPAQPALLALCRCRPQ